MHPVESALRGRLERRLGLLRDRYAGAMWQRVMHRDLAAHSLALAAQQVLSTGPLLVAGSAVTQRLGYGSAGELLAQLLGLKGESEAALAALFTATKPPGLRTLAISALLSLGLGLSVASTSQRMLETMWDRPRAPFRDMWRRVVFLLLVIPGLGAAMYAAHVARYVVPDGPWLVVWLSLGAGLGALLVSLAGQHLLLSGRIGLRRLLPGWGFIGIGIAAVTAGATLVVPDQIVQQSQNYGPIGAGFVLATWLIVMSGVVSTGVLARAVLDERRIEADERRAAHRGRRVRLRRLGVARGETGTRAVRRLMGRRGDGPQP